LKDDEPELSNFILWRIK